MICDTKQSSIKSFFKGRVNWEEHLDITKAVCVWVAKDMRLSFPPVEVTLTTYKNTQTECFIHLKVYFNSLFCSYKKIYMLFIYLDAPGSQAATQTYHSPVFEVN